VLNGHCGVEVRDDGDASLKKNNISRNGHMGLLFYNGAGGLIQVTDCYTHFHTSNMTHIRVRNEYFHTCKVSHLYARHYP